MSLSENDRVMLYGNRTEKLPTLAELSDYINSSGGSNDPVSVDDIAGISPTVETLLNAGDAATARAAIGAGTSNLEIGTTASTAKAGNYVPAWGDVTGKPVVIAAGADAAAARAAIGAGTSNLTLGTTASTALAGNGNAVSASKLQTARTFTFSGAATGSGSFDGTSAVNIALTLSPVSATNVNIEADVDNGVTADTLQATISALAARIQALENPPA